MNPRFDTVVGGKQAQRPRAIQALIRACGLGQRVGVTPRFVPDDLIAEARRRAKLQRLEPGGWRDGLTRLCRAIEDEAALHGLGRWIVREQIVGHLVTRLRVDAFVEARPEVLERPLAPLLIITGMQRTGTTKLQRLLASDPRARALLSWEALEPVPAAAVGTGQSDKRIASAKRAESALRWMAPHFFAIHPVEHLAPEEDVLLLDPSFRSTTPESIWSIPSFSRWLEGEDLREAYTEYRRLLLILQHQRPGRWWVLKTPHHLEFLDELSAVIPEVKLVWTHRDPLTTVPSFCSMLYHGRRVYSDAVDPHVVGRDRSVKVARMVERGLAFRDGGGDDRFLDVQYAELLAEPLAVIERIYAFMGQTLEPHARAAIEGALAEQVQHRYGVHRYSMADFGLDADELGELFGPYRARFGFD